MTRPETPQPLTMIDAVITGRHLDPVRDLELRAFAIVSIVSPIITVVFAYPGIRMMRSTLAKPPRCCIDWSNLCPSH